MWRASGKKSKRIDYATAERYMRRFKWHVYLSFSKAYLLDGKNGNVVGWMPRDEWGEFDN